MSAAIKTMVLSFFVFSPLFASMEATSRTGASLGYVITTGTSSTMVITQDGQIINVQNDGTVTTTNTRYTTTDCTGTTYIISSVKGAVYRNNGKYYKILDVAPINTLQSYRRDDGSCITYSNTSQWGTEVDQILSTDIPFSLPVDMPISISATPKVVVIPLN